jgi:hypothetical protein
VANGASGTRTARTTPAVARRTWPGWLALGLALIAVAVAALVWAPAGASLLLGALGVVLVGRGAVLLVGARALPADLAGRARGLGGGAIVGGLGVLGLAVASIDLAGRVLAVGMPVLLVLAAVALLARGGIARRGGAVLLAWSVLVTGLIAARGLATGWDAAAGSATVAGALAVAVLGMPMLVTAGNLRAVAARPAPARPAACAGCACGAGGCGALG